MFRLLAPWLADQTYPGSGCAGWAEVVSGAARPPPPHTRAPRGSSGRARLREGGHLARRSGSPTSCPPFPLHKLPVPRPSSGRSAAPAASSVWETVGALGAAGHKPETHRPRETEDAPLAPSVPTASRGPLVSDSARPLRLQCPQGSASVSRTAAQPRKPGRSAVCRCRSPGWSWG